MTDDFDPDKRAKHDYNNPDDNRFYRHHVFFNKPATLDWLIDKSAVSPEDEWIRRIDGEPEEELPPTPTLDGLDDDLVWMWHCRQSGMTWKDIAPMLGLRTPAGAWKRFQKLVDNERKKGGRLIEGGKDAKSTS